VWVQEERGSKKEGKTHGVGQAPVSYATTGRCMPT